MIVQRSVLITSTHSGSSAVTFTINVYRGTKLVGGAEYGEVAFKGLAAGGANPWLQV